MTYRRTIKSCVYVYVVSGRPSRGVLWTYGKSREGFILLVPYRYVYIIIIIYTYGYFMSFYIRWSPPPPIRTRARARVCVLDALKLGFTRGAVVGARTRTRVRINFIPVHGRHE